MWMMCLHYISIHCMDFWQWRTGRVSFLQSSGSLVGFGASGDGTDAQSQRVGLGDRLAHQLLIYIYIYNIHIYIYHTHIYIYTYITYIYIPTNVFHQMPGLFSGHVGVQGQGMDDMFIAEKMRPDTSTVGSFTVVGKFYWAHWTGSMWMLVRIQGIKRISLFTHGFTHCQYDQLHFSKTSVR